MDPIADTPYGDPDSVGDLFSFFPLGRSGSTEAGKELTL